MLKYEWMNWWMSYVIELLKDACYSLDYYWIILYCRMQEIDLINGFSFLGSHFLLAEQYFSKCGLAESHGKCIKMQIPGSYPRSTESDTVGVRSELSRRFLCSSKFKSHRFNEMSFRAPIQMLYPTEQCHLGCLTSSSKAITLAGQNTLEGREHWPGIGSWSPIFQASLEVMWPPRACFYFLVY